MVDQTQSEAPTRSLTPPAGSRDPFAWRLIDGALLLFGSWTAIYLLALFIGPPLSGVWFLMGAWAVLAVPVAVLVARTGPGSAGPSQRIPPPVLLTALAGATVALIANRPDADDVFYVNRSTAMAQLGAIPMRDTIYSHEAFSMLPGQYPPIASFEVLLGGIAHVIGVPATSLTYLVVPPLGAALAVLALWRLLMTWRVRWPLGALAVSVSYLFWGGAYHASFGNTWIERMWQGKIVFISFLVPMVLVWLVRALQSGSRRDLLMVWATVLAGVGLTSSAAFVLAGCCLAAAGAAILGGTGVRRALLLASPISFLAAITLLWVRLSASEAVSAELQAPAATAGTTGLDTTAIVTKVLGSGPYLGIGLLAAAIGWLAIRDAGARRLVGLLVLIAAVGVSPIGLTVLAALGMPDGITWRVMWLVPVPALVGAGAVLAVDRVRWAAAVPVAVAGVVVLVGLPITSSANGVTLGRPTYKWPLAVQEGYAAVASAARPGDLIATGEATGGFSAVMSASWWAVNPRTFYTDAMAGQEGFCIDQRRTVAAYAHGARPLDPQVRGALDLLGVSVVQLPPGASADAEALRASGFAETTASGVLRRDLAPALAGCAVLTEPR